MELIAFRHDEATVEVDDAGIVFRVGDARIVVAFESCVAVGARLGFNTVERNAYVGARDPSAASPYIEFFTNPPTRVEFTASPAPAAAPGSKFVRRVYPAGWLELLSAVAERGFAIGDLS